jgi:hypothetical protein
MKLNDIRQSDFSKFKSRKEVVYKGYPITINHDYFNDRWYAYIEDDNSICETKSYYFSLSDLKQAIKDKINELITIKKGVIYGMMTKL